ncbi:MAG TPA: pitrilysin family protein [Terriglobia bacterium]|nr:pitrilysin family protein [Terriglobia bacterium]
MKKLNALLLPLVFSSLLVAAPATPPEWKVPLAVKTLDNGLTVVVSRDDSAPTFGLCIAYGIGFRLEPKGRTGFAHLFEHMMFEGTPEARKGIFDRVVEGGGGFTNGDTRFDFTEYIESAPVSALNPALWLEADRLKGLDFSVANLNNQRNVVEEEVRDNVLNQPYGSFYWLDLPQKAFNRYPNAHNFYGDFKDLDAANIGDVRKFFETYHAPNNAVLAVVGDVTPEEVFQKAQQYFDSIPRRAVPAKPDVEEAPQKAERCSVEEDKLARVPALAVGYRMPPRTSPDAIVGAVVGEMLQNGQASLLYQALVKRKKVALEVDGGVNWPLGTPFEYGGPTLMTSFIVYPPKVSERDVLTAYDGVIQNLAAHGASQAELQRIRAKMRSDWYAELEIPVERASVISHFTLLDGDPGRVNKIPDEIAQVTSDQIMTFCRKYLVDTNRTIISRVPETLMGKTVNDAKGGRP